MKIVSVFLDDSLSLEYIYIYIYGYIWEILGEENDL